MPAIGCLASPFVVAATLAGAAPLPVNNRALEQLPTLVAAERSFAAEAQVVGVREAFLAHLAGDAWIFRPQPVRARAWFESHPPRGRLALEWAPSYAEIAASGDFGVTFGPSRSRWETPQGAGEGAGHFLSVWRRDDLGIWRNVADQGIDHAPVSLAQPLRLRAPAAELPARLEVGVLEARRESLMAADAGYSEMSVDRRLLRLATDAVLLREGRLPLVCAGGGRMLQGAGEEPLRSASGRTESPDSDSGKHRRRAEDVGLAEGLAKELVDALARSTAGLRQVACGLADSGDLGFAVGGRSDGRADAQGSYLRVWRHDSKSGWQLAVDLLVPAGR